MEYFFKKSSFIYIGIISFRNISFKNKFNVFLFKILAEYNINVICKLIDYSCTEYFLLLSHRL